MRRIWPVAALIGLLLVASPLQAAPPAAAKGFSHLEPGAPANLSEQVPVNIVFVGYERADVEEAAFLAALPQQYKPVVRSRLWYGMTEYLGIHYTYQYNLVYADAAYEGCFFDTLSARAAPAGLTLFQQQYNDQTGNVRDVAENHFIDAPGVEHWLAGNPPEGVNTAQNTIFFINWWGNGATPRPGFKDHVYTKIGEPDPDTGYDFGLERASRKLIAWGGTTPDDEETGLGSLHRIWFHDLSAGPESWTDNWNVTDADLDGDGVADYRMPPVWEYFTPGGYRDAAALAGDLAKIARYVAINLLFTPSPLYPPYMAAPRLPGSVNLDLNTFEGSNRIPDASALQTPDLAVRELSEVHRLPYTSDLQDLPFDGEARSCYMQWLHSAPCYPNRPQYPPDANLFLYNALRISETADGGGEYEARFINYATDDNLAPDLLGFADDNWLDGTQSFTFNFISPSIMELGYGLTTTQIHEYGHHFGMSHPHDGYDFEENRDYGPEGDRFFAWSGDEVNSMMSYIDLNWDYSQFDRDNAHRFQAAAYLTNANYITARILGSRGGGAAHTDLQAADSEAGLARAAMAAHDYAGAFDHARAAYDLVRSGAVKAGVTVETGTNGWTVLPPTRGGKAPEKNKHAYADKVTPGSRRMAP